MEKGGPWEKKYVPGGGAEGQKRCRIAKSINQPISPPPSFPQKGIVPLPPSTRIPTHFSSAFNCRFYTKDQTVESLRVTFLGVEGFFLKKYQQYCQVSRIFPKDSPTVAEFPECLLSDPSKNYSTLTPLII